MEITVSLLCSQEPVSDNTLSQINPVNTLPCSLFSIVLISSSRLRLGLPNAHFASGFLTKTLYALLLPPIRARLYLPSHLS
jgi:hypothetical protein